MSDTMEVWQLPDELVEELKLTIKRYGGKRIVLRRSEAFIDLWAVSDDER